MTDNDLIYAFKNGCDVLVNDDASMEDVQAVRRILDRCGEDLMPYVHKYVTLRECKKCKNNKNPRGYVECKFAKDCYDTIGREHFVASGK